MSVEGKREEGCQISSMISKRDRHTVGVTLRSVSSRRGPTNRYAKLPKILIALAAHNCVSSSNPVMAAATNSLKICSSPTAILPLMNPF
jgi:hypothetical protein